MHKNESFINHSGQGMGKHGAMWQRVFASLIDGHFRTIHGTRHAILLPEVGSYAGFFSRMGTHPAFAWPAFAAR
jgi:hypothetical protein